ncbi:P-loop containing nucleoside triphosphate hydrolase protein [Piromyces finnis]|uniref:p-loop containing nucleoside triphosphate hydrolase protein n=1 Tax=Piromyces finnis TaxID=1754191 RepID=A0A1Y1VGN4_9FUNG|nr:P-loop containing nucleoside triphosphate hydrolase protein [Piromyces finnis]|eukprot:ORX54871.1 P-loop containing nucleoside triphosphate hydrolase protein [Piromyces finnis]
MNNSSVKCPVCNRYVTISGINAHLDSNCQCNIVQMDGSVKDIINDNTVNGQIPITDKFRKITNNHIYIGANSVEKKKTFQPTLFGKIPNNKRSNDSILNKKIPNHSLSSFKSSFDNNNNSSNNNNNYNINNILTRQNKKVKLEEKSNILQKFDINKKHDNNVITNPMKKENKKQLPLAELVRPKTLEEYFGQEEIMGKDSVLKTLIKENRVPSMILWGPPGVGKTCLARIISNQYNTFYREISGTIHSLQDLKKASEECANQLKITGKKAILFIDEIHRFNKLQQDSLLSWVERGAYTLIGATTENPSFKLNSALLSRCRVFQLKKLSKEAMLSIIERAARLKLELYDKILKVKNNSESESEKASSTDKESSNFKSSKDVYEENNVLYADKEVLELIAIMSDGDARNSLNILDMAIDLVLSNNSNKEITKDMIKMSFQKTHLLYDKNGEEHYDLISAFHKSIRGSDPDATLYWLGRMVYAGEDPLYIARRLIRIASEDVGFGDNNALTLAVSCYQACQFIGMPECDVVLAHTAVYMARAKKSVEVYKALGMVRDVIKQEIAYPVPMHIRNAPTMLMDELGYGKGYKYNPDYEEPVEQEYLPKDLKCRRYLGVFEENRKKAYLESKNKNEEMKDNKIDDKNKDNKYSLKIDDDVLSDDDIINLVNVVDHK